MIAIKIPKIKYIMHSIFNGFFMLFILSTLFDPMDKLFGLKTYLFILCMAYGCLYYLTYPGKLKIPFKLIIYVSMYLFMPLFSITYYYFMDGSSPYAGFLLLKSYLFITFAILLYITKVDVFRYLSIGLFLYYLV